MRPQPIALQARPKALARPQDFVEGTKPREWYRVFAARDGEPARVDIFDAIDSWGPPFGVSAAAFTDQLRAITSGAIDLHVNSPGGDVWDGIAIMNALVQHPARVTAYVDGCAASIASVIVMGADEIEMGLGAQLMIHDASTIAFGNATEVRACADLLDKVSDNIAGVYAARTGLPAAHWREQMRAETWFNADEAVSAGLASRAVAPEAEEPAVAARTHWAVASWRYPGRDQAPAPISPQPCIDAAACTHAPPLTDSAPVADTAPVQLPPDPVFDHAHLVRALREAVMA
jgi:ATP-dependent protease ClpP protease subunit